MISKTIEYANAYYEAGLTVLPLAEGQKTPPKGFAWHTLLEKPQRKTDITMLFASNANVGLVGGSVSKNLIVLDIDSREKFADLDRYPVFRKLKACSPVVKTYRGYHVYAHAPYPVASGKIPQWKTDILAERRYAVAPPSEVHQEHGVVQLYLFTDGSLRPIYTPSPEEWKDLKELFGLVPIVRDVPEVAVEDTAPGLFYGLGFKALRALRNPEERGRRSEAEQRVVFRAVSIGWSFADVYTLFDRVAAPGTKFREKQRAGYAEQWLRRGYQNAHKILQKSITPRMLAVGTAIDVLAKTTPFIGRARYTDTAVLRMILQAERESGRRPVRVSSRLLAERIGLSDSKIWGALERLQKTGALIVTKSTSLGLSIDVSDAFLTNGLLAKGSNIYTFLGGDRGDDFGSVIASHDAYRRGALGIAGQQFVKALNQLFPASFTVSQLMQKGFAFRYIERVLSLLSEAKLVEISNVLKLRHGRPQKQYRLVHYLQLSDLDRIAELAGTKGEGEKQRERYKKARVEYSRWRVGEH